MFSLVSLQRKEGGFLFQNNIVPVMQSSRCVVSLQVACQEGLSKDVNEQ